MTAINVLEDLAVEVGGISLSGLSVSSTDDAIRQMVQMINAAGHEIMRRADWSKLLSREFHDAAPNEIDLPDDFHRFPESGAIFRGNPLSPVRIIVDKNLALFLRESPPDDQRYCFINTTAIEFYPDETEDTEINYISRQWVDGKDKVTENGDVLLIPEELVVRGAVYRWRRARGQSYEDTVSEFEAALAAEVKANRGA